MSHKAFDLNIEKILENWDVRHAIREVISNALDEQMLTNTRPVVIQKQDRIWSIRDYGRGLKYTHLTQKENQEKLASSNVIGRFGVGLKDALATFDRHGIDVCILTKFGTIRIKKMVKQGFGDIETLHAIIEDVIDPEFIGTQCELHGVSDDEMEAAKEFFLMFSGEEIVETTKYGQIALKRNEQSSGSIYISGVKVAEESNFLFSYNITLLNAAIKKSLNRERSHVGRTAYADSVKKILLSTTSTLVAEKLTKDITRYVAGSMHDEMSWLDVQEHAIKLLNPQGNVIMVTASEAINHPDMMDQAQSHGLTVITIPENLGVKLVDLVDIQGNQIVNLTQFTHTYNRSFVFNFVSPSDLNSTERKVFDTAPWIMETFGGKPDHVNAVHISESMRPDWSVTSQTLGCWDPDTNSIVIWRGQLKSLSAFAGVLIHELIHATTDHVDVTRNFETSLTEALGDLCESLYAATSGLVERGSGPNLSQHASHVGLAAPSAALESQLSAALHQVQTLKAAESLATSELMDAKRTIELLSVDLRRFQSANGHSSGGPMATHKEFVPNAVASHPSQGKSFMVTISANKLVWPDYCASCMGGSNCKVEITTKKITSRNLSNATWQVPYCTSCKTIDEAAPPKFGWFKSLFDTFSKSEYAVSYISLHNSAHRFSFKNKTYLDEFLRQNGSKNRSEISVC